MRKNIVSPSIGNATPPAERLSTGIVETGTLPNGLHIVSNQVPWIHSVTLGLWINAGSREDPEGFEGMAHFIEHALFKGTQKRDYVEIARSIEETGGYIDAWTTKEQTCLCVRCLREHLHLAFDLLADLCCNPVFPPDEIEKEKEVVLEEIASVNDTPEELIFEDFDRRTFPRHPLGTAILGTEESVERLTDEQIRDFMHRHYVPSKMLVTAIGNIDHDEVTGLADLFLGHLKDSPHEDSARRLFDLSAYKPFTKTLKKSVFQSQILLGAIFPRDDRHFWGLMVLNAMLSSGMSSILNLELREKRGLVYQAYSSVSFYDEVTEFNVYAGTDKGKTSKTLDTMGELLTGNVLKEPDPSELVAAKAKMLGSMILGMEKMTRRMSHIAQDMFYFGRYLSPSEKAGMIEGVTAEEVALAAAALGIPEQLSTLVYKPGGR
ncbi:insulinase family protein [Chlorobaculum sp. MV4-Y]|uniref:M16 family metallopeptidase n=1 Tax=Chlorobaculum sp. MV4-Y TaxID=2976335 RepID=UPI0021AEE6AD|nr:pitrilysin family protein [Chlorobaculum sp. MV4-Y]UWX57333.1 insulinase family protein [Chlorobaculum sp. MV4-Y]